MRQFTPEFCSENKMLVLSETEELLTIGMCGDTKEGPLSRIGNSVRGKYPDKKVAFTRISEPELMLSISALERVSSSNETVSHNGQFEISNIEAGAPVITVLNSLLLEAKGRRASDIHLECDGNGILIRLRIDGVLHNIRRFDESMGRSLCVRIKLIANLNTLEKRKPQDGRFSITSGGSNHDIRVSVIPTIKGESIALRFLDTGDSEITLEDLGFSAFMYPHLMRIPAQTQGLVLITGPTGSGKTTTLAALVRNCDTEKRKIISIEDPVEYRLAGVSQIQTNENIGLDFSVLLKRILRQDPDVIMIGEIRDTETAQLAVRAALTGHLVFSTLHTSCAREASARLIDMGIPAYLLETVLYAVVSQRLVRKKCRHCEGNGCTECLNTGYKGRIPIAEIYQPSLEGTGKRVKTIKDEALECVEKGISTQEEIQRVLGKCI